MTVMSDMKCTTIKVLRHKAHISSQVRDVRSMTIGYRSDIVHQRTDVSPVAKHFNGGAYPYTRYQTRVSYRIFLLSGGSVHSVKLVLTTPTVT